ncbi:MAG: Bax inhibitor-1/YccA family protein [Bacteroidia bacterium]|nr:Bax inhibitor-1/YccA family protein [Bacteroidia bacterium]
MNNYYGQQRWNEYDKPTEHLSTGVINDFLRMVYFIMSAGLVITGFSAYLFANYMETNAEFMLTVFTTPLKYVLMFAPLAFVLVLSFGINRMSYSMATLLFGAYAVVMGLSLSFIFLVYTSGSIAATFFTAAGTFGAMAFIGMFTKMDLSKVGSYAMMALIGIIIASIINIWIGSSTLAFIVSILGVLIFCALTAYDTQKIMRMGLSLNPTSDEARKGAIIGALTLYLDFINLFLYLLRFMGNRR